MFSYAHPNNNCIVQVRAHFAQHVADRVKNKIMNPDVWADDPVGLNNPGYR
jgi:hypothetical protein